MVFYWFKRFREDMRTLKMMQGLYIQQLLENWKQSNSMWTGYQRWLFVPKIDGESTGSGFWEWCCIELQSKTKTWNSEGMYITSILWDSFLHALYIQPDTGSYCKFPFTSSPPYFLTLQVPIISPWLYLWPVFLGNLLLMQSVSNFRARISFLLCYIIYLSDITN